jgi:flagellar motor switch protein FliG
MIDAENLIRLDDEGLRAVLRLIDAETMITVLAGASRTVLDRVLGALPTRAAAMLAEDVDLRRPVGAEDLAAASAAFARQVAEAIAAGDLPRGVLERG